MKTSATILSALLLLMLSNTGKAQLLKKLGQKIVNTAEKGIERKAEQKTEKAVDKILDKATDAKTYQGNKPKKGKKSKQPQGDGNTDTLLVKEENKLPVAAEKPNNRQHP